MNILIIHYNTPELTEATIRSLNRVTEDCRVCVFDNSDERPFTAAFPNVSIVNNTRGQEIDFEKALAAFPDKVANRSNWGSAKHCMSVDHCFGLFPDGFLLVDSDVLLKKDVSPLADNRFGWVGNIHTNTRRFGVEVLRIIPYLCYLNVPLLQRHGISYYNPKKMWFLSQRVPDMYYDTGAWLYEECCRKDIGGRTVNLDEYALHFRHGSWREKDAQAWLNENKDLWK